MPMPHADHMLFAIEAPVNFGQDEDADEADGFDGFDGDYLDPEPHDENEAGCRIACNVLGI